MVYSTDIVQTEAMSTTSYVTAHVDYHGDLNNDFFQHQENAESEGNEVTQVDYVTAGYVRIEDVAQEVQHIVRVEYDGQLSTNVDEHRDLTETGDLNQQTDVQNIFSGYLNGDDKVMTSECFHLPDTELMVTEEVTTS